MSALPDQWSPAAKTALDNGIAELAQTIVDQAQANCAEAVRHAQSMEQRAVELQRQLEATQRELAAVKKTVTDRDGRIGDLEDALDEALGAARGTLLPGTDVEAVLARAEATLNGGVQ